MNKKILVVDDDSDILEALQLILSLENYDVMVVNNGREVSNAITTFKPDIILLDVLLSGTDGRSICKTLKSSDPTKSIPVLMLSAHPSAEPSVKEAGADDFISKPFDLDILLEHVKALS